MIGVAIELLSEREDCKYTEDHRGIVLRPKLKEIHWQGKGYSVPVNYNSSFQTYPCLVIANP